MGIKLFQEKAGKLFEIKGGKKFDYEKVIQELIEKNLSSVFPSLEFVATEETMGHDKIRPDSIAFDKDSNAFVIIEYKNIKHHGVLDQGMDYYKLLKENKSEFVLLYNKKKEELYDVDDINWEESRILLISPEFSKRQIRSSQALPGLTDTIELYTIRKYENNIITLTKIESESESFLPKGNTKKKERTGYNRGLNFSVIQEYTEEDYLNGKYDPRLKLPEQAKVLFHKMKDKILDTFQELEFKQRKKYAGFYSKRDGSAICTIEATKSKLKLIYSTSKKDLIPKSNFVQDVSKIGHWGIGNYRSEIKNDKDIEQAIPLIDKVYSDRIS